MKTVLTLPFPPSANNLFVNSRRTGGRFPSARYKAWQAQAGLALLTQPARHNRHAGPVEVCYTFAAPDKRRRDLFNMEKAISDLLVAHGILADDSLIHRGTLQWGDATGVGVEIVDL